MAAQPTDLWQIINPPVARDGDSVYLVREHELYRKPDRVLIERDARPVLCRATWLKCPEISGPNKDPINGPRATADAQRWLDEQWAIYDGLMWAVQYGDEKYGRPLVDIRSPGGSFSIWMATPVEQGGPGWPVYE